VTASAYPYQTGPDSANEYTLQRAAFYRFLQRLAGPTLVQVVSCTNAGGLAAQGSVDVQPLVNQVNGDGQPTPHGVVHKLLYQRIQGGSNAVILDPQPGDQGVAIFASRDISGVKAARGQANPGSARLYDWADGIYLFSVLGGVPVQYFQFDADGITCVSPTQINLQAPTVAVQGNLTVSGTTTGEGDGVFEGTDVHTHVHGGVQTGGGDTGPPV
jgi:hypothetical protein